VGKQLPTTRLVVSQTRLCLRTPLGFSSWEVYRVQSKETTVAEIIDLDNVMLSAEAAAAWHEMAGRMSLALSQLQALGRNIRPEEIPDEQGRIEKDGSLTIFVEIKNVLSISMPVPPDHWARKQ
jgi:hypothetical protein